MWWSGTMLLTINVSNWFRSTSFCSISPVCEFALSNCSGIEFPVLFDVVVEDVDVCWYVECELSANLNEEDGDCICLDSVTLFSFFSFMILPEFCCSIGLRWLPLPMFRFFEEKEKLIPFFVVDDFEIDLSLFF